MKKAIILCAFIAGLAPAVYAHPPASIEAEYDASEKKLSVTVRHYVGEPTMHYIEEIRLLQNGQEIATRRFDEQASDSHQYATFTVPDTVASDIFSIEARCNIGGNLMREIDRSAYLGPAGLPLRLKDGRYTASNRMIDVAVTIKKGSIADIEVLEHRGGGEQYSDRIKPLITRIIDKQTTDVDSITGATISCDALKEAVQNAVKLAAE
jgi:desulfoferrodoxin (superoxide reductase-like protein)